MCPCPPFPLISTRFSPTVDGPNTATANPTRPRSFMLPSQVATCFVAVLSCSYAFLQLRFPSAVVIGIGATLLMLVLPNRRPLPLSVPVPGIGPEQRVSQTTAAQGRDGSTTGANIATPGVRPVGLAPSLYAGSSSAGGTTARLRACSATRAAMAGQDVAAIEFESLHPSIKLLYEVS